MTTRERLRPVEDGLDVVSIEVQDEGAVVVGVVMSAHARGPEVLASRFESRSVKGFDLGSVARRERDVRRRDDAQMLRRLKARGARSDPEVGLVVPTESTRLAEVH